MSRRPLYEQHVSGPALAAFLRVSAAWGLDEPQERMLLGQPSPETLRSWKQNRTGALSLDQVERISYVLRIFRLLQERHGATAWLIEPRAEPIFGGRRPIDVMCLEDIRGLRQVAQFLHALSEPDVGRRGDGQPN
jgi:uncharacterized protein (DUF2384 family)